MTRLLSLLVVITLFICSDVLAQVEAPSWKWVESAPVSRGRHDDIKFANPDTGWLANFGGQIWWTGDGGVSWEQQVDASAGVAFRSLGVQSPRVAWAGTLTPGSTLWETRDHGAHWTDITHRISGAKPQGICGMWVVNEDIAYGVGAFFGSPILIRTDDGGITWNGVSLDAQIKTMIDVYFKDESTGFIVGGTGESLDGEASIIRTDDGGDSWTEVFRSTRQSGIGGEWGWKISFPSEQIGYVAVEYVNNSEDRPAKVLKTEDGGLTWREIAVDGSTTSRGLQGIGFISDTIGWASGRGTTSVTTDGGDTWTQLEHYDPDTSDGQLDGRMNRFYSVSDSLAYAVGSRVYRLSGFGSIITSSEIATEIPRLFDLKPAYPNPFTETTTLSFELHEPGDVRLTIIDPLGRRIRSFPRQFHEVGGHQLSWDGRTDAGEKASSGSYLLLIDIGDSMESKQVVYLK